MVNYFIYAKDYSCSTRNNDFYHENGLKTLNQFKNDVKKLKEKLSDTENVESKIVYLHWGHECTQENEETIVSSYRSMYATGKNTLPEKIIEWIKNIKEDDVKIELLYIITDGLIYRLSMERCMQLNSDMQYKNVVFHAINQNLDQVNLSVAATFLKCNCVIYRNYELTDNVNISEPFDYGKIFVKNFETERENLKSYIKLKYIHKFKQDSAALQEIDKLKKLRNRLFEELSSGSETRTGKFDTKDKSEFLKEFIGTNWYKNLNTQSNDVKKDIEKSISTLINYIISDAKSYSFDALKFDTKFDTEVKEEEIEEMDVDFAAEQEIEFPDIILEDDKGIPVIILTKFNLLEKIIFHGGSAQPASFSKFKSVMECPLFLIKDQDIGDSIGYFYTLNVFKQLLEKTSRTEPRTRKPFHGGLVLTETNLFDKYNDFVLSATYFDSKKVKFNVGLFYFVLWKNSQKEWMDKNVSEQFRKYSMRRISETVCKIGLSSLPLDPQENVSLPTALWYCVELSSNIFKDDPRNFMQERLRMYFGVADCMIEILKYLDYELDLEAIEKRRELMKIVMVLKKIQTKPEKVYWLLEKVFKSSHGFLVSEFKHPENVKKLNYLKFDHKEMLSDDLIEEKVNLNDFAHLMYHADESITFKNCKICDKTFRPFFTVSKDKSFYSELFEVTKEIVVNCDGKPEIIFKPIDSLKFGKLLSLYNLFIRCVDDCEKYPTFSEYMEFVLKKKKFNGDLVTIFPSNLYTSAEFVYSQYQNLIKNVEVSEFIRVTRNYVKRSERIKAEEIVKFGNDEEINEFIASEELKVNLRKKKLII